MSEIEIAVTLFGMLKAMRAEGRLTDEESESLDFLREEWNSLME